MQSNHTVQVALKNMKTQKRLLRAWMKLVMEAPEVSQVSAWDRYGLYIVLYIKKKIIIITVTLYHTQRIISVFDNSPLLSWSPHVTLPGTQKQSLLAGMYRKVLHYTLREL